MASNAPVKKLLTMDDIPLDGKRVLVRVDFNVTVGDDGKVDDWEDYRIKATLPTLEELQQRRCRVILLTHRGEPKDNQSEVSLEPMKRRLEDLLHEEVRSLKHFYGPEVEAAITSLEPGGMALLPNVRTDEREETPSEKFAKDIADHEDVYINEAFSVCHRAHTSVTLLPRLLPHAAGRRLVQEIHALDRLRYQTQHPYVAIVSGAKITTKVGMLRRLLNSVDTLCLGGQIANVFLTAQGKHQVNHYSADEVAAAQALLEESGDKIMLPIDVVIGEEDGSNIKVLDAANIPEGVNVWDVGPKSVEKMIELCGQAKTVMWNGPVGRFEVSAYEAATRLLAEKLAVLSAYRVVGGGDTVNALEKYHVASKFDHVSVGGGAMIAYLEGKPMPGIEALRA